VTGLWLYRACENIRLFFYSLVDRLTVRKCKENITLCNVIKLEVEKESEQR